MAKRIRGWRKCATEECENRTHKTYCREHAKLSNKCTHILKDGNVCGKGARPPNIKCSAHSDKTIKIQLDYYYEHKAEKKIQKNLTRIEKLKKEIEALSNTNENMPKAIEEIEVIN